MNILSALVASISLALIPTSGRAPLTVTATITVTGPVSGSVCLAQKYPKGKDIVYIPAACDSINVTGDETKIVTLTSKGGTPGQSYDLVGVIFDNNTGSPIIVSTPVQVTTTEN